MEYLEFLEQIKGRVQDRVGESARVNVNIIYKNNIHPLEGMTILREDENVSPAIYLQDYYEMFEQGLSMDQIAEEILEYHEMNQKAGRFDVSFYTDFEKVKERIAFRVIHYEKNTELLREVPHRRFLDLALVYYYKLDSELFGSASILVRNIHMEMWGTGEEELYRLAWENTLRLLPCKFMDVVDLIEELSSSGWELDLYQEIPLFVLSNAEKNFGAALIVYPHILEMVGEKLGMDYYVLPSSIHECIIIPMVPGLEAELLHEMVQEMNEEHVEPEEVLGASVYCYRRRTKKLDIVYEDRESERREDQENSSGND